MNVREVDWVVVGSGFGGSVAALRLAQKGHGVEVVECGRRFRDDELPKTTWDLRKYVWSPRLGLRGILRTTIFRDVAVVSGAGVGGGSLVYACTLYRPKHRFYEHPQWAGLAGDWEAELAPHFERAERMLGVVPYDEDDDASDILREVGARLGVGDTHTRTPVGIFLGTAGETVPDPYFGGEGPARTGCVRCAECHLGCRHGAKNTLEKNYLWFAEKRGVRIRAERQVVDVRPAGAPDGSDGYLVTSQRPGAWLRPRREVIRCRGVVLAAGALGTNELLMRCRRRGSLPRLSPRVGELVRTNSEALYAVTLPPEHPADLTRRAVITGSIHPDSHTHVEFDTFGRGGDATSLLFAPLVGPGTHLGRVGQAAVRVLRHPLQGARAAWPVGWSARTLVVLVMQDLDNAIALRPRRRGMQTRQDPAAPIPKHIPAGHRAVLATAQVTGGIPQSAACDVVLDRPATAHILGGAVIGAGAHDGVVDSRQRVFGYDGLLVCDGAAVPANPGVNPSLTITAMAERAMTFVAPADPAPPTAQEPATAGAPRRVAPAAALLLAVVTLLLLIAAPARAIEPLTLQDGRLTDPRGREVVLRGINVHHKLAPFLPPAEGDPRVTFSEADAARLRRWGWNTVRLAVSMEGLMPQPGKVDAGYVGEVLETVRMAARHGQWTLVDMHQDEFSPRFAGNGFPAWAVDDDGLPFPRSLGHPVDYLQPAVQRTYWNFLHDSQGQRTLFVRAWSALATALRDEPGVLGYDLFNEPSCESRPESGFGRPDRQFANDRRAADACLRPLYDALVPAVRAADPGHPVFYEDFFNTAWGYVPYGVGEPPNRPWTYANTGLSYHVYCPHPLRMDRSCRQHERRAFTRALANARRNRAWPLLSEFGAVDDLAPIRRAVEQADRRGLSWQFWSLKTADDPHPGFGAASLDPEADGFSLIAKDGTVKRGKLRLLARPFPERLAGRHASWRFDARSHRFRLAWAAAAGGRTVLRLPDAVHYPGGRDVRATGARIVSDRRGGVVLLATARGRATVRIAPASGRTSTRACRRTLVVRLPSAARGVRARAGRTSLAVRRLSRGRAAIALRGLPAARRRVLVRARVGASAIRLTRVVRTCAR